MDKGTAYALYTCHALSTWEARSYEFAAVIFTAAAYPGGIRAASFIGISTSLAAIFFASSLGRWIDNASSRLKTLLTTIAVNRVATLIACLFWFLIVASPSQTSVLRGSAKFAAFLIILLFGVIENLSRKANVLSIERDWVPILAPADLSKPSSQYDLAHVNAVMARIDIFCKLGAPIAVSSLSSMVSTQTSVAAIAGSNVVSFGLEWWTARRVWENSAKLRFSESSSLEPGKEKTTWPTPFGQRLRYFVVKACSSVVIWWCGYLDSIRLYFSYGVWRASLAMTMTQVSILSVTGVFIVFLLNSGFSMKVITVAEALSTLFELGSTIITPFTIAKFAPWSSPDADIEVLDETGEGLEQGIDISSVAADRTKIAVTQTGFMGISYMLITLIPALPLIVYLTSTLSYPIPQSTESPTFFNHTVASLILFSCLASSRLGRGIFSLTTQQLAQSQVPASHRSSFGGTELVFVSIFGLSHNIGAAVFSEPSQFGWLALASVAAIAASVVMLVWFMNVEGIGFGGLRFWEKPHEYEAVAMGPVQEAEQISIDAP